LAALGTGLLFLQGIGLCLQAAASFDGVIAVALAEGATYLAAVYCISRVPTNRRTLLLILVTAALLRLGTVVFLPYLSTDVYRYVWDGRVQAAGINPYRYIPADDALTPLRDEAIYPHINRADYAHTIYPPAAQIIYFVVTRISERVTAMKLAMLVFDAATIGFLVLLLRGLGAPPDRVVVDGANLRSAPSSRAPGLGQLPTGSPVVVSAWVAGDQVVPDNPTWAQLDDRTFIYSAEVRPVDLPSAPTPPVDAPASGRCASCSPGRDCFSAAPRSI